MSKIMKSQKGVKQYAIFDVIFHHIKLNDRTYQSSFEPVPPMGDYRDIYMGGGDIYQVLML